MSRLGRLYATLRDHASIAAPLPSNETMANAAGIPVGSIGMCLDQLSTRGEIIIEQMPGSARRRVAIVGTALKTDWSVSGRGARGDAKRQPVLVDPFAPNDIAARIVNRDPCGWCGVRGDHGCGCRRAA